MDDELSMSSFIPSYVADRFVTSVASPPNASRPRRVSSLATSATPSANWPSSCTDRGKKWSLKSWMSIARSFAFDEGKETIETPRVRTNSDVHRRVPRDRLRRRTLKKAVVMICAKIVRPHAKRSFGDLYGLYL